MENVIKESRVNAYLEKSKKYKQFHYSALLPDALRYLHRKTFEMLEVLLPIFEQNSICYMICGGTLLGAVTTGHFIPWDDDVDICILDEDYECAIDLLSSSLPEWMVLQWSGTEQNYYHGWVKVRDGDSHVYPDEPMYRCNGVWIDLYKLSRVKKAEVPYLIAQEHLSYLIRRNAVGAISDDEMARRISDNELPDRVSTTKRDADRNAGGG